MAKESLEKASRAKVRKVEVARSAAKRPAMPKELRHLPSQDEKLWLQPWLRPPYVHGVWQ